MPFRIIFKSSLIQYPGWSRLIIPAKNTLEISSDANQGRASPARIPPFNPVVCTSEKASLGDPVILTQSGRANPVGPAASRQFPISL